MLEDLFLLLVHGSVCSTQGGRELGQSRGPKNAEGLEVSSTALGPQRSSPLPPHPQKLAGPGSPRRGSWVSVRGLGGRYGFVRTLRLLACSLVGGKDRSCGWERGPAGAGACVRVSR